MGIGGKSVGDHVCVEGRSGDRKVIGRECLHDRGIKRGCGGEADNQSLGRPRRVGFDHPVVIERTGIQTGNRLVDLDDRGSRSNDFQGGIIPGGQGRAGPPLEPGGGSKPARVYSTVENGIVDVDG